MSCASEQASGIQTRALTRLFLEQKRDTAVPYNYYTSIILADAVLHYPDTQDRTQYNISNIISSTFRVDSFDIYDTDN